MNKTVWITYLGFNSSKIGLHHLYRTLDLLATHQKRIKKHLFTHQQNLFTQQLDVVFYDVTTLYFDSTVDAVKTFKKNYPVDKCIFVADSAMINKSNRDLLTSKGIEYIIGERLKSLPKDIQSKLIDRSKHKPINKKTDKETFSYTELEYQGRRIICTYSAKRARKDFQNG